MFYYHNNVSDHCSKNYIKPLSDLKKENNKTNRSISMLSLHTSIIKIVYQYYYGGGVHSKHRKTVDKVIKNYVLLIINRCKVKKKSKELVNWYQNIVRMQYLTELILRTIYNQSSLSITCHICKKDGIFSSSHHLMK